ncbi:MAG: hypothetical protein KKA65_00825 [Nanoarchaeota archaeon]|nr:hypothetical protein [Nanoarchaeota archaeon]MBU4242256.1 hypothetical protein [Nanoarchaeota archaeon]MBU4352265.1 hypothetical protein [Nanoarchaeota archaeon]MBU4456021.1 hypothetical protein [Nanoarchaeota archaeon]MCG2719531.1 hypothetical protein [Nanoarchaeota archaeon]
MGLWNKIFGKKDLSERVNDGSIHCQTCNEDLSELGGLISDQQTIYCQKQECYVMGMFKFFEKTKESEIVTGKYFTPKEIQEAIKEGTLVHYKPIK